MVLNTPKFQQAIETVEALSIDEQAVLLEILHKRLLQQQHEQLLQEAIAAEQDDAQGNVKSDSAGEFLAEVDNFLLRIAPRSKSKNAESTF
ncbi:hypothetical protein C7Y66_15630 [Chroococcidiopsis sp. CCALA 051]|uniref:hypothetical protein n=1 Tax=Chroococcidiopsis sp. CCALA 051 TaxID=869949 RepID=UPI000D0CE105|nr:hypothetical protein [Chroococcidiopsis sp. CCALA 051]MBE9015065.1 hypothetical protein [Chroococcidiopsidales cyanobacterium LEGE 13417]PSM48239.1 hypothetical protein C7Y66_15630 [Chroococcidiopsis sp. CCALA 051]